MGTRKPIFTIGKGLFFIVLVSFILLLPAIFPHRKNLTIYLQAIGVAASSIIALFAIWGEQIRARFFGPKLVLSLYKPEGEETSVSVADTDAGPEFDPIRFYHLKVENKRKGLIARNVQVILLSIESPYKGKDIKKTIIGGRLPFKWAFRDPEAAKQDKKILYYSTIGPDDICDFACLRN